MTRLVLRRLALALPLALGTATLVFVLLEASPVEPCAALVGEAVVDQAELDRLCEAYGLNGSPLRRYWTWLTHLAQGDLGFSVAKNRPVATLIGADLRPTVELAIASLAIYLVTGLGLGVLCAWKPGGLLDRWILASAQTLYGMPLFWLGLIAAMVFGGLLGWLPTSSYQSVGADAWSWVARLADRLAHLILPASVIGLAAAGGLLRFVRNGLVAAEGHPSARAARARGLTRREVIWRHSLRQTLLPVIQLVGLALPALLSGALVIEVVFSRPGLGRLAHQAVLQRDYPTILATVALSAVLVVLGTLSADVLSIWADPRLRHRTTGGAG